MKGEGYLGEWGVGWGRMTMQNSRKLHLEEEGSLETSALGEKGLRQVRGGGWNRTNGRMLPVPESRF